ncbi:hypothetical protein D1007_25241 [Hordeum vulgare]|nr:hypothetical protein D1007_25241 [Hordeum vulgare]
MTSEALLVRHATPVDPQEALLARVLRRSLTTTETDACILRRKNVETLRPAIQLSKCEATKEVAAKAKAARHSKERVRLLRRLSGMRCSFDEEYNDVSTMFGSDDDDADAPLHADAYTEEK